MAIDKGSIKAPYNYEVMMDKPFDARSVRPTKADLIKKESWSSDGSTIYVYEGMQVYVQDEKKTYYLKDLSKMFATDFSGWELMGTGAAAEMKVIDNLESESTTAALSANQGRVLKGMIGQVRELKWDNSATSKAYNLETVTMLQTQPVIVYAAYTSSTTGDTNLPYWGVVELSLEISENDADSRLLFTGEVVGANDKIPGLLYKTRYRFYVSLEGEVTMEYDIRPVDNYIFFVGLTAEECYAKIQKHIKENLILALNQEEIPPYTIVVDKIDDTIILADNYKYSAVGDFFVYYTFKNKRYKRTYTSVEIITEEIALGGGSTDVDLYPTEYSDEFNDDFTI